MAPGADWRIDGPVSGRMEGYEQVLRALPKWFGIESALLQYVRDAAVMPTFLATAGGALIGFLSVREHFPESAEIHVMAVRPEWHRRAVGSALVEAAERWLADRGVRFLQVKTLSPARPSPEYAATRAFYRALGFAPVEEFPTLWSAANPCLMLIKIVPNPGR
jgi:GNAT superfamily N-acetyltransferase